MSMEPLKLLRTVQRGLMHHAYILYGEDIGAAEETAQKIANFFEHGAFEVSKNTLVESLIIRPSGESVGIDDVRRVRRFLAQKPARSACKTVIITRTEYLTAEAQNALLKIMEEPPEYARIFLIVSQKERIFPTVRSRAHAVHFPLRHSFSEASPLHNAPVLKFDISSLEKLISEGADDKEELDKVLYSLLDALRAEPVKNFSALRETVKRITILKQSNANKRLQLKSVRNAVLELKSRI